MRTRLRLLALLVTSLPITVDGIPPFYGRGQFTGNSQEDAQEFLGCLLQQLHEELELQHRATASPAPCFAESAKSFLQPAATSSVRSSRSSSRDRCHSAAKEVVDLTFDDGDEHSSNSRRRERSRSRSRSGERGGCIQDEQLQLKQIVPTARFFQAEVDVRERTKSFP